MLVLDHLRGIAADAERSLHEIRIAEHTESSAARNLSAGIGLRKLIRPFCADFHLRECRDLAGSLLFCLWRSLGMSIIDESRRQRADEGHAHSKSERLEKHAPASARGEGNRTHLAQHSVFLFLIFLRCTGWQMLAGCGSTC